jgi:hypothetical protein
MVIDMITHRERLIKLLPQTRILEAEYSILITTTMTKMLERYEAPPGQTHVTFPPPIIIGGELLYLYFGVFLVA